MILTLRRGENTDELRQRIGVVESIASQVSDGDAVRLRMILDAYGR